MPEQEHDDAMMAEEEMMMPEEQAETAEFAENMPDPEEMLAMEEAMAEAEMNPAEEDIPPALPEEGCLSTVEPAQLQLIPVDLADPGTLEPHPYADLLPRMRDSQFAKLRESIELDGLQNPIIIFQGKILDGRNRCQACEELGIPVAVFEFVGSEQQALVYVLSSNQHRRDLTPHQRAAVAVDFMSQISEDINQKRIEKLRQTLANKAEGECLENSPNTQDEPETPVNARLIAASIMGVNDNYVGLAKRIKEASPELFEEVWAGRVTIPEALRQLDGSTDDPRTTRVKTIFRELRKIARNTEKSPAFLDRLEALVAEFAER